MWTTPNVNFPSSSMWHPVWCRVFQSNCLAVAAQLLQPLSCTHTRGEQMELLTVSVKTVEWALQWHLHSTQCLISTTLILKHNLSCFKITLCVYTRDFTASPVPNQTSTTIWLVSVILIRLISKSCRHTPHIETLTFHNCHTFKNSRAQRSPENRLKTLTTSL